MKPKDEAIRKYKWLLTIVITFVGVYLGFRYVLPLIIPFIISYLLAMMIRPSTEFLYRRFKINRIIGGTISLVVFLAIVGTGIFYLVKILFKQAVTFIRNIPIYFEILLDKLDNICKGCDEIFGFTNGTAMTFVDDNLNSMVIRLRTDIVPGITERTISFTIGLVGTLGVILIILIAAILIVKDLPDYKERFKSNEFYQDVHKVTEKLVNAGMAYLRCQLIIICIIAVISTIGLTILGNRYALLLGIIIAAFDALPIIGSGMVYIPWSIIMLINGDIYSAAILITIFLVCQIIREILEPRLIGNRIGIKPLYTLMSMYIGVRFFSIAGFILGPIGLVIITTLIKVINDRVEGKNDAEESLVDN